MSTPSGRISQDIANTTFAIKKIENAVTNLNKIVTDIGTQTDNAGFQGDAKLALDDAAATLQTDLRNEIADLEAYGQLAQAELDAQEQAEDARRAQLESMGSTMQTPTYPTR
ncbi:MULTISPECIES: hypothetical protein [Streptomyces]|uniref:Uncharacterized protein n=1 Tax=Streptomyces viridochromogenes TaxID=1938 RepID=A0A0L8JD94_STRVR|nr:MULTISPECIES: hypothetical protein [Streptomyces]KOG11611.1 hypothetical protein ADK34_33930 [Streptomyces viridochromogenes]